MELLGGIFSRSPMSSVQGRVQSGIQVSGLLTFLSFFVILFLATWTSRGPSLAM